MTDQSHPPATPTVAQQDALKIAGQCFCLARTVDDFAALIEPVLRVRDEASAKKDERIAKLETSVAGWKWKSVALGRRAETAEAQLADARRDVERLDWMQQHRAAVQVREEEPLDSRVTSSDDFEAVGYSRNYNIRSAIDSAMSAKQP